MPTNLDRQFNQVQHLLPTFDAQFRFDAHGLEWEDWIYGAGSYSFDPVDAHVALRVTTANGDQVTRQIRRYLHWGPSHGYVVMLNCQFGAQQAGTVKRVGLFSPNNGYFLQQDGSGFSVVVRSNGVDTIIPRAAWIDRLDGSGPAGVVADLTQPFILFLDQQVDTLRFGYVSIGNLTYIWESTPALAFENLLNHQRALPMCWEIFNTQVVAAPSTLDQIYGVAAQTGPAHDAPYIEHVVSGPTLLIPGGTTFPIIAVRPVWIDPNGLNNRTRIIPQQVNVRIEQGPALVSIILVRSGTTTPLSWTGTWTAVSGGSLAQFNTSLTTVPLATGQINTPVAAVPVNATFSQPDQAVIQIPQADPNYFFCTVNRNATDSSAIVVTVQALSSMPVLATPTVQWKEELT